MGAGKSTRRTKTQKESYEIQKKLKYNDDINFIMNEHPNIEDMKFTKSGLNFLQYIILIRNEPLFESCAKSRDISDKILSNKWKKGNKLIHFAIDTHNRTAVYHILRMSNGDEAKALNENGITATELAKRRDNPIIMELFGIDWDSMVSPNKIITHNSHEFETSQGNPLTPNLTDGNRLPKEDTKTQPKTSTSTKKKKKRKVKKKSVKLPEDEGKFVRLYQNYTLT